MTRPISAEQWRAAVDAVIANYHATRASNSDAREEAKSALRMLGVPASSAIKWLGK